MNEQQQKFLKLAVVNQLSYDEIEKVLDLSRQTFAPWWDEFKEEREYLASIRSIWNKKCSEIDFEEFKDWFENADRKCFYCGITEHMLSELWEKYPDLTKRNRGRKLEIDRKEPNKPYSMTENLVFSCYWCNNAKTDTFTESEFAKIGEVLKEIWKSRLNDS